MWKRPEIMILAVGNEVSHPAFENNIHPTAQLSLDFKTSYAQFGIQVVRR